MPVDCFHCNFFTKISNTVPHHLQYLQIDYLCLFNQHAERVAQEAGLDSDKGEMKTSVI